MNVQMFFVQADAVDLLSDSIRKRLKSPPDAAGQQPDWGLPSSYDVFLRDERKRKVALSPPACGWIAGIESKEVLDFALLQQLSETLKARVIAVQLSEVTGCSGYALSFAGELLEHQFSEEDRDPAGMVAGFLRRNAVPWGLVSFREAVQMRDRGWVVL